MKSGLCKLCNMWKDTIQKRRLNTAYYEKERNYLVSCISCYEKTCAYYSELWQDFYSSIL